MDALTGDTETLANSGLTAGKEVMPEDSVPESPLIRESLNPSETTLLYRVRYIYRSWDQYLYQKSRLAISTCGDVGPVKTQFSAR